MTSSFLNISLRFWVKVRALGKLVRIVNLGILFLTQFMVTVCLTAPCKYNWEALLNYKLWLVYLATILVASAGYVINDYYDVKIDSINKPRRVTIDRHFRRTTAIWLHAVLNLLGIAAGFLVGLKTGILVSFTTFLLWYYSNSLKRQPLVGNLAVSLTVAISILLPQVVINELSALGVLITIFAAGLTIIRELIKDIEDMKGDASFGCRTLPIVIGIRPTKWLIWVVGGYLLLQLAGGVVTSFIPTGMMRYHLWLVIPFMGHLMLQLYKADTVRHFDALSSYTKLIMLAGVTSMVWAPWC